MTIGMESHPEQGEQLTPNLHLVAWELTRSCNLFCAHCRGSSAPVSYSDELTTEECFHLVDQILEVGHPIIILTGGEPLTRPDVLQIAGYAVDKGLRVVMGTNGTLITEDMAAKLKSVPVSRLGISLDFPLAELQDNFRGQDGAFEATMAGIANARQAGIEIQINSTITKMNVNYLEELLALTVEVGAVAFHPFMLVPTGRGKGLETVELPPEQYEQTLNWLYDKQMELGDRMFFKPTDVPHYMRVVKQREKQDRVTAERTGAKRNPANIITRGCLAGIGFCFVSSQGKVKGCGYLDVAAGDIRKESFGQVWANSPLFLKLRDLSNLKGKCGICEYKRICGGCRARAYEATGDCFEAEPYCIYEPVEQRKVATRQEG
ncbi:radical SAM protein [Chloroflexota bacterium]